MIAPPPRTARQQGPQRENALSTTSLTHRPRARPILPRFFIPGRTLRRLVGITGGACAIAERRHWCPLVSIAAAIRDGLVRVSGIDPKGMELPYRRRIFARYAVTGTEHPLELLESGEIGALTKYIDRKTRDAITNGSPC